MTPLFEVKTDLLLRQTRRRLPAFSEGQIEIAPIEKGGSDRRFYRVRCVPEQSLILVKYDLEGAENRHYVRIAEFLAEHGIAAPKIYFHDAEEGLIWIEDLGESDLFSFRDDTWLVRGALYRSAVDEIAKLHDLPESEWAELHGEMPPEFNATLYRWEQNYFFENCLGRIFGLTKGDYASSPRYLLLKTSRSDWESCRGCWCTVIFSRKTSLPEADMLILSISKGCVRAWLSMIWHRCYLIPTSGSRRMSGRNFTLIIWSAAACHRLPKCGKHFGYAQCNA